MTRFTMPRDFYIPKTETLTRIDPQGLEAEVYTYEAGTKLYAIGFRGKQSKPAFHFRYQSAQQRAESIQRYLDGWKASAELKAKIKTERSQPHSLKVGDILKNSWGYEQTNVEFFQVTRVVGPHSVEITPIGADSIDTGWLCGKCSVVKDKFIGEPMVKRANADNSVKIHDWGSWARPWSGQPIYWSAYA